MFNILRNLKKFRKKLFQLQPNQTIQSKKEKTFLKHKENNFALLRKEQRAWAVYASNKMWLCKKVPSYHGEREFLVSFC